MNKITSLIFLLLVINTMKAQVFVNKKVTWLSNIETAQKIAKEQKKQVLVYFSGSDWCIPCKELKNEVFSSEIFKKKASEYILVNIDFPRSQRKLTKEHVNYIEKSAEKYNSSGAFPFVAVLNDKGVIVKSVDGYKSETASYYIKNYLK